MKFGYSSLAALVSWVLTASAFPDDSARLAALLEPGGNITLPPGDYHLEGTAPLKLVSGMTVSAYGARFHFPDRLPDKARRVLFAGQNVQGLTWMGGEFIGHVFDPARQENAWEPNASTKGIEITTTEQGHTSDILFRDVRSRDVAGAVIGVHGHAKKGSESEVITFAERVALESCTLLRSGKFMWDYGYLWQILLWPESYEPWEVERAKKYYRMDLIRHEVRMQNGDDRVFLNNRTRPLPVSKSDEPREALCFMSPNLPSNVMHGRQYFIVESTPEWIRIAETPGGKPLRFEGGSDATTSLVFNLSACYLGWAPIDAGPGKGAFDLTATKDVRVTGCQLSALGDTMHIQACHNVVFANNQILGSRMGAFFLAEFCKNATITGNLIDGTNGSRVMSVEKSCEDVTITGNTFRNGGRGSWINQPKNFILQGNVFVDNTTKNNGDDMRRGRIAYQTGKPVAFPELYVTLYEDGASYGPVIIRDNVFSLGAYAPENAVTLAPNGQDIQISGNIFKNKPAAAVVIDPTCQNVITKDNQGVVIKREAVHFNHGRR